MNINKPKLHDVVQVAIEMLQEFCVAMCYSTAAYVIGFSFIALMVPGWSFGFKEGVFLFYIALLLVFF